MDNLIDHLLETGVMTGPHRRTHPLTLNLRTRFIRWAAKKEGQCREFIKVYRQYRAQHSRRYAARIAYGIAFNGLPF
jgi:hypothetical protein